MKCYKLLKMFLEDYKPSFYYSKRSDNVEFKKYPSIENSYREKNIHWWKSQYPEIVDEKYIIVEKIHGANFQIIINKDDVKYASRNRILEDGEGFYNYLDTMDDCSDLINKLQNIVVDKGIEAMRVYGELFGANIQKGVDYGDEVKFKIFDIYFDDKLLTQMEAVDLLIAIDSVNYFVPIIQIVHGLEDAMNFNEDFDTNLFELPNNNAEGIVIKPYEKVYQDKQGSVFYLKKKSDKFLQRQKSKKVYAVESSEMARMWEIYSEYLNDNRVQGIFSKYGEIEHSKDIGKYIRLVLEDAKEDFLKDNIEEYDKLDNKDKNRVFSITGKHIVPILQSYL